MHLSLAHEERPEATLITLRGELDILTAPKFGAYMDDLMRRRAGDVLVDLTEVRFMDSAGLQILLSVQRRVARRARWRALVCPAGPVRRVIDLARMTEALGVIETLEEYERRLR